MRPKISTFALICLAFLLALAGDAHTGHANRRLEILECGFYGSAQATQKGTTPSSGTVTSSVQELSEIKMLPDPLLVRRARRRTGDTALSLD